MPIKTELHEMSNILMRLRYYLDKDLLERAKSSCTMLAESLERAKHDVYIGGNPGLVSVRLGDRFSVIRESLPHIEAVYGLDIELNCTNCHEDDRMFITPDLGQAAFSNVVQNAAKAGATKVWVDYITRPYTIEILYRDNGKGMTEEEIESLGFGYSSSGGGRGIELVRKIIHDAGGTISWRSIPHLGTEVKVVVKKDIQYELGKQHQQQHRES